MAYRELAALLREARHAGGWTELQKIRAGGGSVPVRAVLSQEAVADLAGEVPGGYPDFDRAEVERHENRIRTPTDNGLALRTHLAALSIPLVEASLVLGYWPDLRPRKPFWAALEVWCRSNEARIASANSASGTVVVALVKRGD